MGPCRPLIYPPPRPDLGPRCGAEHVQEEGKDGARRRGPDVTLAARDEDERAEHEDDRGQRVGEPEAACVDEPLPLFCRLRRYRRQRPPSPLNMWIQTGSYILVASSEILASILRAFLFGPAMNPLKL
ncbi:hypothetical protein B0H17DRAFT_418846 [Mycena rosella]|uniref:Uncharacterized protein n=1 Tax=Mycena rosella TaxID=1033263 RepID=A0AAD7FZL2_MYCRO|nr:hypothetical protein B0H17DRAFT_418846 [Mycena rosella]